MVTVFLSATIFVLFAPSIMRRLARFHGWLILKLLLTSQAVGLGVYLVQSIVGVVS